MEEEIDVGATITMLVATTAMIIAGTYRMKRRCEKTARHIRRKRKLEEHYDYSDKSFRKDATAEDSDSEDENDGVLSTPWDYEQEEARNWLYLKTQNSLARREKLKLEQELFKIQMSQTKLNRRPFYK